MSRASLLVVVLAWTAACLAPLPPADAARVRRALDDDAHAYPELAARMAELRIAALDDDEVFFQSNFEPRSLLGDAPLAYVIQANPRAFGAGIDDDALRGVLGHELAHTLDYETRSKDALVDLVGPALVPARFTWERHTDLVAVERGFGMRLLHYRAWLFRVLDVDAVARKRSVYYSPLELALLVDVKARCPRLFQRFLTDPPRDAHAIATHCP